MVRLPLQIQSALCKYNFVKLRVNNDLVKVSDATFIFRMICMTAQNSR